MIIRSDSIIIESKNTKRRRKRHSNNNNNNNCNDNSSNNNNRSYVMALSSAAGFAAVCAVIVILLCAWMLYRYARADTSWVVLGTVYTAWLLSFAVCFLLPLDLAHGTEAGTMFSVWNTLYWTSFLATWLVIPLLQEYYEAGEFTVQARLRQSVRANLIFYSIAGSLFVVFLVYVAVARDLGGASILGFAVCLGNTWGLILAVMLLGYGIVEIPRRFWRKSQRGIQLKYYQFQVSQINDAREEQQDQLTETLALLRRLDARIPQHSELRESCDVVVNKCPVSISGKAIDATHRSSLRAQDDLPIAKLFTEGDAKEPEAAIAASDNASSSSSITRKNLAKLHSPV
jgi:hypothetical protein